MPIERSARGESHATNADAGGIGWSVSEAGLRGETDELGWLAMGERRNRRILTKCQDVGANDCARTHRLDSAKPGGEARGRGVARSARPTENNGGNLSELRL
jgi:hypothetical protein